MQRTHETHRNRPTATLRWLLPVLAALGLVAGLMVGKVMPARAASIISIGTTSSVAGAARLFGIACASSTTCYAAGNANSGGGTLIPITNGTIGTADAVAEVGQLFGIACASSTTCYAAGYASSGGTITPITSGSPGGTTSTLGGAQALYGIACPSSTTCLAVGSVYDGGGTLTPITNGAIGTTATAGTLELDGIACADASTCYAVGYNSSAPSGGTLTPITNGAIGTTATLAGTGALDGIACADASTCYAVGTNRNSGTITPITNGAIGTTAAVAGTGLLYGIACPSSTTCYAVGYNSSASSGTITPITNGAIGTTATLAGTGALDGIACADVSTCYAVGYASSGGTITPISLTSDDTAPTTTATITGTAGASPWYTSDVSVRLSPSDPDNDSSTLVTYYAVDNTGCAAATETTDCQTYSGTAISIVDGAHTLTDFSVDPAGNAETPQTQTFDVDTIPPTLSFSNCPSSVLLHSTASADWTASDGGSGLASASSGAVTLATGSAGSQSVSAPTATDNAGNTSNTATCAYSVHYQWSGFAQPINDPAADATTMSVFKAGSTIPVKFELHDASGALVQAGSLPTFSVSAPTACSSASVDASGTTDTGDTGSSYRWDSTSQQYIYNYHTDSSLAGMCQSIQATLDDGTTQRVEVAYK